MRAMKGISLQNQFFTFIYGAIRIKIIGLFIFKK